MAPLPAAPVPVFGNLLDKLIPDTAEAEKVKAELELRLVEAANQAVLAVQYVAGPLLLPGTRC